MSFFEKLKSGLAKTRGSLADGVDRVLQNFVRIDEELFDELEEALIMSDIGVQCSADIIENLRARVRQQRIAEPAAVRAAIVDIVAEMLDSGGGLALDTKPSVVLVVGVNGVGKTTSIAKLAALLKKSGKKVLLGAADTFRAAAIEQLSLWADRAGVEIVRHSEGADPAAVVFDACSAGKSRGADCIIIDTAGRLHNKKNLMNELDKISRVIDRELPGASKQVLLVIDAATGQNGVNQAREFRDVAGLTGIILTKLDGTAKGGVVVPITAELGIPVRFVGVGEQIDDFAAFDPRQFAEALFLGDGE